MAKSSSGQRRTTQSGSSEETSSDSALKPMMDAMRAHPVATAAAVAAGGLAVARLARGSRERPVADTGKKAAPKKAAAKAPARKRAAGGGLTARVKPDATLAAVIGSDPLTRADITKRMWDYIKQNGLQDGANRRMINADARLRPLFGSDQVSMFEMTRLVSQHVSAV